MPKMSDHEDFLNASMVKDKDILVVLDEGVFREPEETGLQRTVFQIRVELPDKRAKTWGMNKTTRNRLARVFGDSSENWVNRRVRVQVLQQNVRGEVKDVIYGWPIEEERRVQTPLQTKTVAAPLESKGNRLVRFTKAYESYKVEDVANLDAKTADGLILLGLAVPIDMVP